MTNCIGIHDTNRPAQIFVIRFFKKYQVLILFTRYYHHDTFGKYLILMPGEEWGLKMKAPINIPFSFPVRKCILAFLYNRGQALFHFNTETRLAY